MKKIFLFIGIIGLSVAAHAQLGVLAGMNLATWRGDDADGAKSLTGFYVGVNYNVPINEKFSFQPEAQYSMEGTKDDADISYKTSYINVTPIFRYNASGFFVGTGPMVGFLMSAKADDGDNSMDIKDLMKSTNFAWALMAGYEFSNGFGISARYNMGLANVIDADDTDVKTGVFQIGLRYNFKMGGSASK